LDFRFFSLIYFLKYGFALNASYFSFGFGFLDNCSCVVLIDTSVYRVQEVPNLKAPSLPLNLKLLILKGAAELAALKHSSLSPFKISNFRAVHNGIFSLCYFYSYLSYPSVSFLVLA